MDNPFALDADLQHHHALHWHVQHPADARAVTWSLIAAYADGFCFNYAYLVRFLQLRNETCGWGGDPKYYQPTPIPTPVEFLKLLEFREGQISRAIGHPGAEWSWPSEWGSVHWNGPILRGAWDNRGSKLWNLSPDDLGKLLLSATARGIMVHKLLLGLAQAFPTRSAAALLERLAEDTWDRLDLSSRLKCPHSEETYTDINLLELVRYRPLGLQVYKARGRDEPEKGFDWEWYVRTSGPGWWRYSVQAKKLDVASNRYARLQHRVGARFQIDILADFARSNRTIPLYCFYNAMPAPVEEAHWHCNLPFKAKQLGCSVAPLAVAQHLHRPRVHRSFEIAHQDPRVLPWRCIVSCPLTSAAGHHLLAPPGLRVQPLPELPPFLREEPAGAHTVDLPHEGYASHLGGFPRWIMVLGLRVT